MNRTNIVVGAIAVLALLIAGSAQTVSPQQSIGRYQVFSLQHTAGSTSTRTDTLRIDTLTGETSVWVNGVGNNGTLINTWAPIK
ncbi:MAG TPA: hypothetical protein VHC90_09450 [Bryobacteraceae bacterium]|nr:hypothetical protein [Bryobacteraceae bacterium]